MTHHLAPSRALLALLLVGLGASPLAGCSCEGGELETLIPLLVPDATRLDLGGHYVGEQAGGAITLQSEGTAPVAVTAIELLGEGFTLDAPPLPLSIPPGTSAVLPLTFSPPVVATYAAQLRITADADNGPRFVIALVGEGLEVPPCDDDNPCTDDRFDPVAEACVSAPREGSCSDPCLVEGSCINGACIGELVTCAAPDNPCEQATCEAGVGCVILEDPAVCDDEDPCTLDTCDATEGCGHETLANGTPCGPIDGCASAPVCLSGACTDVPVPDGVPCDDLDLCTASDRCLDGACVGEQQPATPEVTGAIPAGESWEIAQVGDGYVVAAIDRPGGHELLLFLISFLGELQLIDTWPVDSPSFWGRVRAAGPDRVLTVTDAPGGGTQHLLVAFGPDGFEGEQVIPGIMDGLSYVLRGSSVAGDHELACFNSSPFETSPGELWHVDMSANPQAESLGLACTELVDAGPLSPAYWRLDHEVASISRSPPFAPSPVSGLPDVGTVEHVWADESHLVIDVADSAPVMFNLMLQQLLPLDDNVIGEVLHFGTRGLWAADGGVLRRYELSPFNGQATEADVLQLGAFPSGPLTSLVSDQVRVGNRYITRGLHILDALGGGAGALVTHGSLVSPDDLVPDVGGGALVLSPSGVAAVGLDPDGAIAHAGGSRWGEVQVSLLTRSEAGAGPTWVVGTPFLDFLYAAWLGDQPQRIVGAATPSSALPRGSVRLGLDDTQIVQSDGRYLLAVEPVAHIGGGPNGTSVIVRLFDLQGLDLDAVDAPLPLLAELVDEAIMPGFPPTVPEAFAALSLHGASRTAAFALPLTTSVMVGILPYDDGELPEPLLFFPTTFNGAFVALVAGPDSAVLALDLSLSQTPAFSVRMFVHEPTQTSSIVLDIDLEGAERLRLLAWDGEHLVAAVDDELRWYDVVNFNATQTGALPLEGAVRGLVAGSTLFVASEGRVSAVQPPCPPAP